MENKRIFFTRAGLILAGIALICWWSIAASAWKRGATYTHATYWNEPVGTVTVFVLLLFCTLAWFWGVYRYWNWDGRRQ